MAVFTGDQLNGKQFSSLVQILSQQSDMRFANNVRTERITNAEEAYWQRLAPLGAPTQKTERYGTTPYTEAEFSRRRIVPAEWQEGSRIDKHDVRRYCTISPENDFVTLHKASLNRWKDTTVINAAFGTASAGKAGELSVAFKDECVSINGAGTATTLGTLAVDGSPTAISLAKMSLMLEIFNNLDVDPMIPKYWGFTPKDSADLLNIATFTSKDYVPQANAIESGKITYLLGFNLFWSNLIPKTDVGGACYRNLVWARDGLIMGYLSDVETKIDVLPEHQHNTQIFSTMDVGAVRFDGDKVHECLTKVSHT